MTALNVYIDDDEAHIFVDGGCYVGETHELVHLGTKVLPLCGLVGALAWSGPAYLGYDLLRATEAARCGDLWECEEAIRPILPCEPHSVLLVSPGLGLALQEGGQICQLYPGDYVKSLPSETQFDPGDIIGSGLRMMREQRASGVVHGFCLHARIGNFAVTQTILERW